MSIKRLQVVLASMCVILSSARGQVVVKAEYQKLGPSVTEYGQSYGVASALDGDTLAVGAIGHAPNGAVFVYERNGSVWADEAMILGPADADLFGRPLALDGDTLVVGDTSNDNANGANTGAAYVYARVGTDWTLTQKLIDPQGPPTASFTERVDLVGSTLVITAGGGFGVTSGSGVAFVYEWSGTSWNLDATLVPSQGAFGWTFGNALDIDGSGGRVAVGAQNESTKLAGAVGAAYVFRRTGSGWVEEARLSDPLGSSGQFFGQAVALDDTTLVVGADGDDDAAPAAGAAWFYERSGTDWTPTQKVYASDAFVAQRFGNRARLAGDTAVITAYGIEQADKGYHFQRVGGVWTEVAHLVSSEQTGIDGYAENMTYAGGNLVVTGALCADWNGVKAGAVYFHVLDVPAIPYCTGKTNSAGCTPVVSDTGTPTFTGPDDYAVLATNVLPRKPGLFFYGLNGSIAVPFFNATLCVAPPLGRTPVQLSSPGVACGGAYTTPIGQAFMASAGMYPGVTVHGQYWMRDPAHPDGTGVGLSDALEFSIRQ